MRAVRRPNGSGGAYGEVRGKGWTVSVYDVCTFLRVEVESMGRGGAGVRLDDARHDRLVRAWDRLRPEYGCGPTAAEVRDAIMACRDVLREEVA